MSTAVKIKKKKKGFLEGYKTYNPEVEGYGNTDQWKRAFNKRMNFEEAEKILSDNDPYSILKISPNATFSEIKKAYRKLILEFHPDKNPGKEKEATEQARKIIAAYTVLKKKFNQ